MQLPLTKNAVQYAALLILETGTNITSLEVKSLLRNIGFHAKQETVSDYLAEIAAELPLPYTIHSNGYRVYSQPSPIDVINNVQRDATVVVKGVSFDLSTQRNDPSFTSYLQQNVIKTTPKHPTWSSGSFVYTRPSDNLSVEGFWVLTSSFAPRDLIVKQLNSDQIGNWIVQDEYSNSASMVFDAKYTRDQVRFAYSKATDRSFEQIRARRIELLK